MCGPPGCGAAPTGSSAYITEPGSSQLHSLWHVWVRVTALDQTTGFADDLRWRRRRSSASAISATTSQPRARALRCCSASREATVMACPVARHAHDAGSRR